MAETNTTKNAKAQRKDFVSQLIGLPFSLLAILVLSMLLSTALEWVGIYYEWWSLPDALHAKSTMESEVTWLDGPLSQSLVLSNPVQSAKAFIGTAFDWLFVKSQFLSWVKNDESYVAPYAESAMYIVMLTIVRMLILVLSSPLFLLVLVVGFVDGLVNRDLRKFGAGRESAFVYHHAKRLTGPLFFVGWMIYLSLPFSIHPNVFLLPNALLFGLTISIATSSFKKYV